MIDYDTAFAWPNIWTLVTPHILVTRTGVWPVVTSWYGWELQLFLHFEKHGEKWVNPVKTRMWPALERAQDIWIPRDTKGFWWHLWFVILYILSLNPRIATGGHRHQSWHKAVDVGFSVTLCAPHVDSISQAYDLCRAQLPREGILWSEGGAPGSDAMSSRALLR